MVRGCFFAIPAAVALVVACAGTTTTSGGACATYYDALVSAQCNGSGAPASEEARVRARFLTLCSATLALPGLAITASQLEACGAAMRGADACRITPPACVFQNGTLAGGAGCSVGSQCQSGSCSPATSPSACGTCDPAVPVGGSCGGAAAAYCVPGATCNFQATPSTCVATTEGDIGASCTILPTHCRPGLACNSQGKCALPVGQGAPCQGTNDCTSPFVCLGSTCQSPLPAGATCNSDYDCARNLACDRTANVCAAVQWASAGQPCGNLVRCLVGSCQTVCPAVIPDGRPCSGSSTTSTCDTFAQCTGGSCELGGAVCK